MLSRYRRASGRAAMATARPVRAGRPQAWRLGKVQHEGAWFEGRLALVRGVGGPRPITRHDHRLVQPPQRQGRDDRGHAGPGRPRPAAGAPAMNGDDDMGTR